MLRIVVKILHPQAKVGEQSTIMKTMKFCYKVEQVIADIVIRFVQTKSSIAKCSCLSKFTNDSCLLKYLPAVINILSMYGLGCQTWNHEICCCNSGNQTRIEYLQRLSFFLKFVSLSQLRLQESTLTALYIDSYSEYSALIRYQKITKTLYLIKQLNDRIIDTQKQTIEKETYIF